MPAKFISPLALVGTPPHRADTLCPKLWSCRQGWTEKYCRDFCFGFWCVLAGWGLLCSHTSCSARGLEKLGNTPWCLELVLWETWEFTPSSSCCAADGFAWLGQVLGWACPCAGKILRLRLNVVGWEIGSVLKPSSLSLGLVSNRGLSCLQGWRKSVASTPSPAIQPELPRAEENEDRSLSVLYSCSCCLTVWAELCAPNPAFLEQQTRSSCLLCSLIWNYVHWILRFKTFLVLSCWTWCLASQAWGDWMWKHFVIFDGIGIFWKWLHVPWITVFQRRDLGFFYTSTATFYFS